MLRLALLLTLLSLACAGPHAEAPGSPNIGAGAATAPQAAPTPSSWTVYRSDEDGYEMQIPADWTVRRDPPYTWFISPGERAFVNVEVYRDPPAPPAEWIEKMLDHGDIGEPEVFDVLEPLSRGADGRHRWAGIRYRYRFGPEICVHIVRHLIVASEEQTYKVASGYCEEHADVHAQEVAQIFEELRYWK
ncbi:MAG: hypothetical protein OXR67_08105 [Chloroflexota bacterium]|nr:hypothetical protein [Chloroflexota bacterium]